VDAFFGEGTARRDAKRYRRKGLDRTARTIVEFLRGRGIEGRTVLEIGGGVGALEIELLKAGAEQAVNVELSAAYDAEGAALAREAGLEERIDRRYGDFAAGMFVKPADVVLLHRVVCCYPDAATLVGAAAERAEGVLVLSYPRESRLVRAGFALANVWHRRIGFRIYVHPVADLLAAAERRGLQRAFGHRGRFWQVAALERAAADSYLPLKNG
jgi:magnesium-protoporphyrin O-methyltransferase